jgi:hypothetical protein
MVEMMAIEAIRLLRLILFFTAHVVCVLCVGFE